MKVQNSKKLYENIRNFFQKKFLSHFFFSALMFYGFFTVILEYKHTHKKKERKKYQAWYIKRCVQQYQNIKYKQMRSIKIKISCTRDNFREARNLIFHLINNFLLFLFSEGEYLGLNEGTGICWSICIKKNIV